MSTYSIKNLRTLHTNELIIMDRREGVPTAFRKRIRGVIVKRFEKYVFTIANKYLNYSPLVGKESLYANGNRGILLAIDSFDLSRNVTFSTWVYRNIQLEVWHSLREGRGMHRYYLPIGVGDESTVDVPDNKILESEEEGEELLTTVEKNRLMEILEDVYSKNFKYYCIVVARFGLHGDEPLSNKECSEALNVSPSTISQCLSKFYDRARKKYGGELTEMYTTS